MKPYLIIFDIDETLYDNRESRIPDSTLEAINKLKAAGHTLAIATGRAPFELIDEAKQLPFDFFILANGQLVMWHDEIIYENAIEMNLINELMTKAEQHGVHIGFNSATHSSVTGITDEMATAFAKYHLHLPEVSRDIKTHGSIYQIWYFSEDIADISREMKDKLRFIPWLENGADVIPIGVSKAVGLMKALEFLADERSEKIIFFGDGINDIELIEMADIGVAMGNAVPAVKAVADFITKNIEADGIYYACEQLGLFEDAAKIDDEVSILIEQLKNAIATEPDVLENYFRLKSLYVSYMRAGALAFKILEDALEYFPNHVKLLVELAAVCEFELEDDALARMYYERVLTLDPAHELALNALEVLKD